MKYQIFCDGQSDYHILSGSAQLQPFKRQHGAPLLTKNGTTRQTWTTVQWPLFQNNQPFWILMM